MRFTVFGLGYLGATHAACMAELGHEVLGVEVDRAKLDKLRGGQVPFYEPQLEDMLAQQIAAGRLSFTDDYAQAAAWSGVHFITVGTPQRAGEFGADTSYVWSVIDRLVPLLTEDSIIIGKSTVPAGTTDQIAARAEELARPGVSVEVSWNPEFLREGHAVSDTLQPDRIVLGVAAGGRAESALREIYAPLEATTPFVVMSPASAELVKVAANAFLATKISFINAIADVCESAGADVAAVATALGHDARIGPQFLKAGLGFGGGCLPKDIRAFSARAGELGVGHAVGFLREVDSINMRRRFRMVDLTRENCPDGLIGSRVAVLGAAFKPETDDVRDSPALAVAGSLQLQGAAVRVYDPRARETSRSVFPTLEYSPSALDACKNAQVILVLTEWDEFVDLDPLDVNDVTAGRVVIDGRFCLDRDKWQKAGWRYVR